MPGDLPHPTSQAAQLTGEHSRHKGGKHEEEHGEEEAASVVEDLAGIVTDVQVEETNEHPNHHVGHEPQVGEDLWEGPSRGEGMGRRAGMGRPHRGRSSELPSDTQAHRCTGVQLGEAPHSQSSCWDPMPPKSRPVSASSPPT